MARVAISRGLFAIVDDVDLRLIEGRRWHAHPCQRRSGGFYASASVGRNGTLYMHRLILNAPRDWLIDHVNGDGLDNRRANIRLASRSQNLINRHAPNPTGFRGVSLANGKFIAKITLNRKAIRSARLATAEEAALAYDAMATIYHGEFAVLNFPCLRQAA